MSEFQNANLNFRVSAAQKRELTRRAAEQGETLTDYVLGVIGAHDDLEQSVANLREQLDFQMQIAADDRKAYAENKTALDRATDLAGQVTAEKLETARRQAVAEYRARLLDDNGEIDPSPEAVAELQQRLALYETPALRALFEEAEGNETDIIEDGQPVTVELTDLPDVVRVLVALFAVNQPQVTETEETDE